MASWTRSFCQDFRLHPFAFNSNIVSQSPLSDDGQWSQAYFQVCTELAGWERSELMENTSWVPSRENVWTQSRAKWHTMCATQWRNHACSYDCVRFQRFMADFHAFSHGVSSVADLCAMDHLISRHISHWRSVYYVLFTAYQFVFFCRIIYELMKQTPTPKWIQTLKMEFDQFTRDGNLSNVMEAGNTIILHPPMMYDQV